MYFVICSSFAIYSRCTTPFVLRKMTFYFFCFCFVCLFVGLFVCLFLFVCVFVCLFCFVLRWTIVQLYIFYVTYPLQNHCQNLNLDLLLLFYFLQEVEIHLIIWDMTIVMTACNLSSRVSIDLTLTCAKENMAFLIHP